MIRLLRTVRFAINPPGSAGAEGPNAYAGRPSMRGLGRHYEVDVRCVGEIHPIRNYLLDIKDVDRAIRSSLVPAIQRACDEEPGSDPGGVLARSMERASSAIADRLAASGCQGRLESIRWRLSPYYSVEVSMSKQDRALLRQSFEFAASHRLHVPSLSAEENVRLFGKCTHPSGHGHNYRVEPCVEVSLAGGSGFGIGSLEEAVEETILSRYDHKHLNLDTPEFSPEKGGVNPSVENIARVFFERLEPAVRARGGRLASITVWESDRTGASYPV